MDVGNSTSSAERDSERGTRKPKIKKETKPTREEERRQYPWALKM